MFETILNKCYDATCLPHNGYSAGGIYARHAQYLELYRAQPIAHYEVRALASVFQRDSSAMRIFCCAFGGAATYGLSVEAKQRYFNHYSSGLKWRRKSVNSPKIVWHKSVCPSMIAAHELLSLSRHNVHRGFYLTLHNPMKCQGQFCPRQSGRRKKQIWNWSPPAFFIPNIDCFPSFHRQHKYACLLWIIWLACVCVCVCWILNLLTSISRTGDRAKKEIESILSRCSTTQALA